MKIFELNKLNKNEIQALVKRPAIDFSKAFGVVKPMLEDIKRNGLSAALSYAKQFDSYSGENILVSEDEFSSANKNLSNEIKTAILTAAKNIRAFHERQFPKAYQVETMPGVKCSREFRAIENVGLYIPGGSAILPSTMLMLGIPASIAGCKRVVACSPAKDGKVNDALLFAAKVCGVKEFYKLGGAQAVALMAYGCEEVKKVDKFFGPGNQFVTAAKLLVSIDVEGCAIDMPAGPSEVLVIADEFANSSFVASDLLSQAEHGADSQVVLLAFSKTFADSVLAVVEKQLNELPRKEIAAQSLKNSFVLICDNLDEAISFSNNYAPEHLILHLENAERFKDKIINAGSVFLGEYSTESVGDYASGTNHSLPTYGYAKSFGSVSVESFMKSITFQQLSKEGLQCIAPTVTTLAETEMLSAHKNAVMIRLKP
ncbi:MAG: histidinol dehydrogenase [Ignavibacteriaceae bacterium]|jgi:histidinol dehydrogenase|nr:histidinol dehydrogenase [Ignavibacteriaceae bacterium]